MIYRFFVPIVAAAALIAPASLADVARPGMLQYQQEVAKNYIPYHERQPDLTTTKVETRACSEADIIGGLWKMVYYRETPPRKNDRYNRKYKHQYMSLSGGEHFFYKLRSSKSFDDMEKVKKLIKPETRPGYEQKYILKQLADEKSEIVFLSGKKALFRHSCTIVKKPVGVFKEGDMILTGYTQGGKTLLYELYRRWF